MESSQPDCNGRELDGKELRQDDLTPEILGIVVKASKPYPTIRK